MVFKYGHEELKAVISIQQGMYHSDNIHAKSKAY